MRSSNAGWKRNDLDKLYEGFGFIIEHRKRHDKAFHPDYPQLFGMLPRHNPVGEAYIDKAIENIDKLLLMTRKK